MLIRIIILTLLVFSIRCNALTFMEKSRLASQQHLLKISKAKKDLKNVRNSLHKIDSQLMITTDMIKDNKNYLRGLNE